MHVKFGVVFDHQYINKFHVKYWLYVNS